MRHERSNTYPSVVCGEYNYKGKCGLGEEGIYEGQIKDYFI